jgi:hypothetical protein
MPGQMDTQIRTLVANFTEQLARLVEGQALDRARARWKALSVAAAAALVGRPRV